MSTLTNIPQQVKSDGSGSSFENDSHNAEPSATQPCGDACGRSMRHGNAFGAHRPGRDRNSAHATMTGTAVSCSHVRPAFVRGFLFSDIFPQRNSNSATGQLDRCVPGRSWARCDSRNRSPCTSRRGAGADTLLSAQYRKPKRPPQGNNATPNRLHNRLA